MNIPETTTDQHQKATTPRWRLEFRCWDEQGDTQAVGYEFHEHPPSDEHIAATMAELRATNERAVSFLIQLKTNEPK